MASIFQTHDNREAILRIMTILQEKAKQNGVTMVNLDKTGAVSNPDPSHTAQFFIDATPNVEPPSAIVFHQDLDPGLWSAMKATAEALGLDVGVGQRDNCSVFSLKTDAPPPPKPRRQMN